MTTSRQPLELTLATDQDPPDDLDQAIKQRWGELMGIARQIYKFEMNAVGEELSEDSEEWLTCFGQVAVEAALADPEAFCLFCEYYLRGPGGNWAVRSTDAEPISRPETEADLWELTRAVDRVDPAMESTNVVYLWIMGLLVENRLKPMLLAIPFLVRLVRDGAEERSKEDLQDAIWKAFFTEGDEEWGDETVHVEQLRTVGEAYSNMSDSIEMIRTQGLLAKETTDRLEAWLESLSHDEIPPDQLSEGDEARYGLVHLRDHALHGNHSQRENDSIVVGYAGLLKRSMEGEDLLAPTMMKSDQLRGNVSEIFGLTALHTAWETCLRNLYMWLDVWGYNTYGTGSE